MPYQEAIDGVEWSYPAEEAAQKASVDSSDDISRSTRVYFSADTEALDTSTFYEWSGW